MKICSKCKKPFPATPEYFYEMNGILRGDCKNCSKKSKRKYYLKNKHRMKTWHKIWIKNNANKMTKYFKLYNVPYHRRLKLLVINHYGGKCACPGCKERNPMFLTIDHINNDGAKHRKKIGKASGSGTYRWLVKHNFPKGFQVLCFNCNCGKRVNGGVCPHIR